MTPPTDLRPLLLEAADESRTRLLRTAVPGGVLLLVLGLVFAALWTIEIGMGLLGGFLAVFGGLTLAAAVLRHRATEPVLEQGHLDGQPLTVVRAPRAPFVAGFGVLGLIAAAPLAFAGWAAVVGRGGVAFVAGAIGLALAAPALAALSGRFVSGELVLDPHGLRYRHGGLESTLAWADLGVVEADEPVREVRLTPLAGRSVRHRYRAGPLRGQRSVEGVMVLEVRSWAVLATDLARLVLHYAEHPSDRAELGTRAPATRFWALRSRPVVARSQEWVVGSDDEERRASWYDATRPLLRDPIDVSVQQSMLSMYRGRAVFGLGLLTVFLAVAAGTGMPAPAGAVAAVGLVAAGFAVALLAFVDPRGPRLEAARDGTGQHLGLTDGVVLRRSPARLRLTAVAGAGLATALAAVLVDAGSSWSLGWRVVGGLVVLALVAVPVLVLMRVLVATELTVDEAGLTYRSGFRTTSVAWADVERADLVRDDVVRVGLRDGRGIRLDLRSTAVPGYRVAGVLGTFAADGGPRGETRDVEGARRRFERGR